MTGATVNSYAHLSLSFPAFANFFSGIGLSFFLFRFLSSVFVPVFLFVARLGAVGSKSSWADR